MAENVKRKSNAFDTSVAVTLHQIVGSEATLIAMRSLQIPANGENGGGGDGGGEGGGGEGGSGGTNGPGGPYNIGYQDNSSMAGLYGGGGGGAGTHATINNFGGGRGGDGAVRIIWPGDERAFPTTLTSDQ